MTERSDILDTKTKEKIEESLKLFQRIRVPLAKFEKRGGKEKIYSGVPDSFINKDLGVGWRIHEHHKKGLKTEVYYRKDLGDKFLELLKIINEDIRSKSRPRTDI